MHRFEIDDSSSFGTQITPITTPAPSSPRLLISTQSGYPLNGQPKRARQNGGKSHHIPFFGNDGRARPSTTTIKWRIGKTSMLLSAIVLIITLLLLGYTVALNQKWLPLPDNNPASCAVNNTPPPDLLVQIDSIRDLVNATNHRLSEMGQQLESESSYLALLVETLRARERELTEEVYLLRRSEVESVDSYNKLISEMHQQFANDTERLEAVIAQLRIENQAGGQENSPTSTTTPESKSRITLMPAVHRFIVNPAKQVGQEKKLMDATTPMPSPTVVINPGSAAGQFHQIGKVENREIMGKLS